MNKIYKWVSKHKIWFAVICVAAFVLPLIIVHVLSNKWFLSKIKLFLNTPWLITEWGAGDILQYVAGFEAFAGTVLLGALTLWQNERFKEENDKSQERLQKISEEQAKALDQILMMDKASNIPLIDLKKGSEDSDLVNLDLHVLENGTGSIKLFLTNITEYPIKDIHVYNLELFTYRFKYIIDKTKDSYNPHKGLPGHYDTHAAFQLQSINCEEKNAHFENACPGHMEGRTKQQDTEEWAYNNQFILLVTFDIINIYGKKIRETITYEFRRRHGERNPLYPLFDFWNKELNFEILEEPDHA